MPCVSIKSCQKLGKFKTKSKKGALGIAECTGSYTDGSADASYLLMPSIVSHFFSIGIHSINEIHKAILIRLPTNPTLLDVLSEVYNKIAKMLGPSPFHSAQCMMGPLSLLSPHPGVSYLFPLALEGSPLTHHWQPQSNTHQSNLIFSCLFHLLTMF